MRTLEITLGSCLSGSGRSSQTDSTPFENQEILDQVLFPKQWVTCRSRHSSKSGRLVNKGQSVINITEKKGMEMHICDGFLVSVEPNLLVHWCHHQTQGRRKRWAHRRALYLGVNPRTKLKILHLKNRHNQGWNITYAKMPVHVQSSEGSSLDNVTRIVLFHSGNRKVLVLVNGQVGFKKT